MTEHFTVAQFMAALPGSGGIISTIAQRVGCTWQTAQNYIKRHSTLQAAYTAEREKLLDTAEGVVSGNIAFAMRKLQEQQTRAQQAKEGEVVTWEQVDSDDAKWVLGRLGKHRGYAERHEISGPEGGPIVAKQEPFNFADYEREFCKLHGLPDEPEPVGADGTQKQVDTLSPHS